MSDAYLPRLGGIEVQVRDLALRLVAAGHDVEVFTTTVGPHGERGGIVEVQDGIKVHRLAVRMPFGLPWNPRAAIALRRRLQEAGNFDVAHVHMGIVSPFALETCYIALDEGIPLTMTWHCMLGPAEPAFSAVGYFRWLARQGIAMNAVSRVAAAPVQRVIGDAAEVTVLPNGIDMSRWWQPANASSATAPPPVDGPLRVITAMRLAPRKRPLPMLRVMRRVRSLLPGVPMTLTVLGEGQLQGRMEQFIERHGMGDWVELAGRVTRTELMERYRRSHVYLSPARLESFGIAALEARCVGLPVVGLASSGASEFVESGVNGFLSRNDEAMAQDVARLLTDHPLRERMHRHNVTVPPSQDWSAVVDRTLEEYRRAQTLRGLVPAEG